jgi:phosphatidylglycerophosphate synthase
MARNLEPLKTYEFKCTDKSLLAKYVLGRYWDFVLGFFPRTIAPNAITLAGLLAMVLSVCITFCFDPGLEGNNAVSLSSGALLWFYSTMDSIDGKQARRIGAGSPLGQLFDHGCDSLVSTLVVINLASALALGKSLFSVLLLNAIQSVFYWVTAQEFYTNHFSLGYFGPTEGILLASLLHVLVPLVGRNKVRALLFLDKASAAHIFFGMALILLYATAALFQIYKNTGFDAQASICKKPPSGPARERRDASTSPIGTFLSSSSSGERWPLSKRMKIAMPHALFILQMVSSLVWFRASSGFFREGPNFLMFLVAETVPFSLGSILLIYSHHQRRYSAEAPYLVSVLVILMGLFESLGIAEMCRQERLVALTAVLLLSYTHSIYVIIREITGVLGIYCFSTKKRKTSPQPAVQSTGT